ncbi:MAG: hypothetical protein ABWY06_05805 [Pseudomonas sp.]|uniref:hypothetical protein n=1 Tax=Pseudomonas sp. TaxID=306 RepID=UPI0033909FE7
MRKFPLLLGLGVSLGLASLSARADDWLALTLYPGGSVYQASHLQKLVAATENLWTLRDSQGQPPLAALDSLASTNAIAVQGDDVRFRRLIETRELTPAGLQTLAGLVDHHPLLGPRLVSGQKDGTHFWFRLAHPYSPAEQGELLNRYAGQLAGAFGQQCRVKSGETGALAGLSLTEWEMSAGKRIPPPADTLKQLQALASQLRQQMPLVYSAADLLGYLRLVLNGEPGLPTSGDEVAQLYMIAESVRSRDLQALARPDFKRLNLVALGPKPGPPAPGIDGYRSTTAASWSASPSSYLIVDCR